MLDRVKFHLYESAHIFKDGTTGNLVPSGWTTFTVTDGNYMSSATVVPLSARDVYLAECIETYAAGTKTFEAGNFIEITTDVYDEKIKYISQNYEITEDSFPYQSTQGTIDWSYDSDEKTLTFGIATGTHDLSNMGQGSTANWLLTGLNNTGAADYFSITDFGEFTDVLNVTSLSTTSATIDKKIKTQKLWVSGSNGTDGLILSGDFQVYYKSNPDTKTSLSSLLNRSYKNFNVDGLGIIYLHNPSSNSKVFRFRSDDVSGYYSVDEAFTAHMISAYDEEINNYIVLTDYGNSQITNIKSHYIPIYLDKLYPYKTYSFTLYPTFTNFAGAGKNEIWLNFTYSPGFLPTGLSKVHSWSKFFYNVPTFNENTRYSTPENANPMSYDYTDDKQLPKWGDGLYERYMNKLPTSTAEYGGTVIPLSPPYTVSSTAGIDCDRYKTVLSFGIGGVNEGKQKAVQETHTEHYQQDHWTVNTRTIHFMKSLISTGTFNVDGVEYTSAIETIYFLNFNNY